MKSKQAEKKRFQPFVAKLVEVVVVVVALPQFIMTLHLLVKLEKKRREIVVKRLPCKTVHADEIQRCQ